MRPELKKYLTEKYSYKIEMHAHSNPASRCSEIPPEDLVRHYKDKGYDAVVLTNHFVHRPVEEKRAAVETQLTDYRKACEAGEKLGIRVLLGAEIRFAGETNDFLLYGVDENILLSVFDHLGNGLPAFRENFKLEKSLLIQAHPFRASCQVADSRLLDGIEVINLHPHHNSNVHLGMIHAKEHPELIRTAGSDYHHDKPGHCGTSAMRFPVLPKDSFELAELLRKRDYLIEVLDTIVIP